MRLWIILFLLVTQSATYAATVLSQGARNVKNGAPYGGASAVGDGVHDDTQAFLDAMNIGRSPGNNIPQGWSFVSIYVPPGTYLVHQILVLRGPFMIFGEPSNRPTIVLKANSAYYASGANGGANPFIVTDEGWRHPAYDNTWKLRDGTTYVSTNNMFDRDIRDINFTVQSGNPSCNCVMLWSTAQQSSIRNMVLTGDAAQASVLVAGDAQGINGSGGGGGIIANITCNGGQNAVTPGNGSYFVYRSCTFNGPVQVNNALDNFIACTFNNPGGSGFTTSSRVCLDDCVFTTNTPFNPGSNYHLENSAGNVQKTASNVYYNGALEPEASANLAVPGVVKGSPYANPAYPTAPSTTVNVVTQYGADPTGGSDSTIAIRNAYAVANASVYFPPGTYVISGTITIGPGQRMYGSGTGGCILSCSGGVAIAVTGNGVAGVVMANVRLTGSATTLIQWDGDPSSQVLDVQVNGTGGGPGPSAFFRSGGGLIENAWWVTDDTGSGRQSQGPTINSTGPLYLYSFAPEHYAPNPLVLTNAENVYGRAIQFEIMDAGAVFATISGGSNINLAGIITSGSTSSSYICTLTNSPQVALWELIGFNSTPPGAVLENGTVYGTTGANTFLEGFVVP